MLDSTSFIPRRCTSVPSANQSDLDMRVDIVEGFHTHVNGYKGYTRVQNRIPIKFKSQIVACSMAEKGLPWGLFTCFEGKCSLRKNM